MEHTVLRDYLPENPKGLIEKLKRQWPLILVWTLSLTVFAVGIAGVVSSLTARKYPLVVTACTLESYDFPEQIDNTDRWRPGPTQSECNRPFAPRNDSVAVRDGVHAVGQVCNPHDIPVSVEITVRWESIENPGLGFISLQAPFSYEPGCAVPYEYLFATPEQLTAIVGDIDGSLGDWKIVGTAVPVDQDRYRVYQWDVSGTFQLVKEK